MDAQHEDIIIAYVLDVLEPAEREAVEIQIARNPALRDVVQATANDIHMLALTAPTITPPPAIKQQLMARIARDQQRTATARPRPAASRWTSLAWVAMLLLVVGLGGWNIGLRNEVTSLHETNIQLTQDLSIERDTRVRTTEQLEARDQAVQVLLAQDLTSRQLLATAESPSASGTMYMQPGNPTAVLVVDGLQPLPGDRTYQFWLARDGKPVPSSTFVVDASGHTQIVVRAKDEVNAYQQVMITIEPVGGSQVPSDGATVLEGNL